MILEFALVGMKYRLVESERQALASHTPFEVSLDRDHGNKHDENAIGVYMKTGWSDLGVSKSHIGYVPRDVAAKLAPKLDKGTVGIVKATVTEIDNEGLGHLSVDVKKTPPRASVRKRTAKRKTGA
jgi:hypothetical protein